jgi:hypothetical protein
MGKSIYLFGEEGENGGTVGIPDLARLQLLSSCLLDLITCSRIKQIQGATSAHRDVLFSHLSWGARKDGDMGIGRVKTEMPFSNIYV